MNSLAARDGMAESHTEVPEGDLCASHAYHNSKALKEYSKIYRPLVGPKELDWLQSMTGYSMIIRTLQSEF